MTVPAAAEPESTYELLASAACSWPYAIPIQRSPDSADYARCRAWTCADLAAVVTRLLAATLGAQAAGITGSPVLAAAGPETEPGRELTMRASGEKDQPR